MQSIFIAPKLEQEINELNQILNAEVLFTAKIVPIRPPIRALDSDIMDDRDWHPTGLMSDEPMEALEHVAICHVVVYKDKKFYCTLPTRLIVYYSDFEFLSKVHNEAVELFNEAYRKGIIK